MTSVVSVNPLRTKILRLKSSLFWRKRTPKVKREWKYRDSYHSQIEISDASPRYDPERENVRVRESSFAEDIIRREKLQKESSYSSLRRCRSLSHPPPSYSQWCREQRHRELCRRKLESTKMMTRDDVLSDCTSEFSNELGKSRHSSVIKMNSTPTEIVDGELTTTLCSTEL